MKITNMLVVMFFVFSLITAITLELISDDYKFVPGSQVTEERDTQPIQTQIPEEIISKFIRTSGKIEPGNVLVQVIFLNPLQDLDERHFIFQVALNTQNVNLTDYDISKKAVLEDSSGRIISEGIYWTQLHNERGRHLMGILAVSTQEKDNNNEKSSTIDNIEWVKLTINGLPGIEKREFLWNIELKGRKWFFDSA
jgi:hypothetical protein